MKAIVPFKLTCIPIKKLALINFEKDPDEIYRGLELQYLDGLPYGTGWRIIAYRNDNYIDVYDDNALTTIENEDFDVAEKGLKQYIKTELKVARFEKDKYGVHICFSFQDILKRKVSVQIQEHTKRNSKAMNMLAPIGSGSENPTSLPLFFLYEFDFVRKRKTKVLIEIGGKRRRADNFPYPITKEFQWRYYIRYSMDCHIAELAKAEENILILGELDEHYSYKNGETTYYFNINDNGISLKTIAIDNKKHQLEIVFDQPLPIESKVDGEIIDKFHVNTDPAMGSLDGTYQWKQKKDICTISLSPDGGWTPVPNSFLTKMIFSPKSVFCSWPKSYRYIQEFNTNTFKSKSEWIKAG
jgi:hypothetical protein